MELGRDGIAQYGHECLRRRPGRPLDGSADERDAQLVLNDQEIQDLLA